MNQIKTITVKQYKTAFTILRERMSEKELLMLETNYKAPNSALTASQMANMLGFRNFNAANLHYGKLAGKFCELFQFYPGVNLLLLVEIKKLTKEWHWTMHPRAVQALRELNWFGGPMEDFVQYHNSEAVGLSCLKLNFSNSFRISTSKSVSKLKGHRVWLIGGEGRNPRKYYLCNYFIVDQIGNADKKSTFKYIAESKRGVPCKPPILLNNLYWFNDFLKSQQNFSFGLRRIEAKYVTELEKLASNVLLPNEGTAEDKYTGGGFGDPETNKRVERAAISFVTKHYQKAGWSVLSVEQKKIGYDLLCKNKTTEEHVEVKGVQGVEPAFIITSGEVARSKTDKQFVLCVVTSALSNKAQLRRYTANEFNQMFSLEPTEYRASSKRT